MIRLALYVAAAGLFLATLGGPFLAAGIFAGVCVVQDRFGASIPGLRVVSIGCLVLATCGPAVSGLLEHESWPRRLLSVVGHALTGLAIYAILILAFGLTYYRP